MTEPAPRVTGYEVLARVGEDPEGPVLRAREVAADRIVALRRMSREEGAAVARVLADLVRLDDPHVVRVRGLVREPSASYLVMEWVEGATLAEVVAAGERLVVGQMLGIVRGVLLGLAHAHEHGVVHGRVGAAHVLLDADGHARLMDFGLGGERTATDDVRDVATLLVELLTGQPVTERTLSDKKGLRRVDAALRPVLARALAPAPDARQPDARVLLAELGKAARRAYGRTWWTEAGLASLVGPALPRLVPLAPPVDEQPADPDRARRRVRRGAGALAAVALVAGAVTGVVLLRDDEAAEPVSFRTDRFCDELDTAASAIAGAGATTRFDSSGSRAAEEQSATGRATVSCYWGGGANGTVVSITVGSRADVDEAGTGSSSRTAALLDGANQKVLAAAKGSWRPSYGTRCEALADTGYDDAFSCVEPVMALPAGAPDPGSVRVVLVATTRDQALVCGATRAVATAAEGSSPGVLVGEVGDLCGRVLTEVRRGG